MKKKLLALIVPFCCLGFSVAYAQSEEPVTDVSKEVSVSTSEDVDQATDNAAPPSFAKKRGCGCGGKA